MENGICYIVGAGENHGLGFVPNPEDYVIAADGGFAHLQREGIRADMVIGDFDSLTSPPEHGNVVALPSEKDDTDTFAAVREGIGRGYGEFHIYGGTGGRFEHTFANIQTLAYLSQNGMRGRLIGGREIMTAITDGALSFDDGQEGYISVFALSDRAEGVSLRGLKYELEDAEVSNSFPIGVSNEFVGKKSEISVKKGTLLIIYPK